MNIDKNDSMDNDNYNIGTIVHMGMDADHAHADDMDFGMVGKVCATRTNPDSPNIFAKGVRANTSKKLEFHDNASASDVLSSSDATMYQAL